MLEDIQWADLSSLQLLSYLVRRLRHGHTLVVATLRSDEITATHPAAPIVGELVRTERARRLDLTSLSSDEIGRIVRDVMPALPHTTVAQLVRRSEGNPFFAEALASTSAAGEAPLPPTLRELLLLRIGQVDGPARSVLDLVAIAGRPVSIGLLAAMWDGGHAELEAAIAEALDRGLLLEAPASTRLFLRHALVAEALEARIPPVARARLHELLAVVISGHPELGVPGVAGRAGELARHWLAGDRHHEALSASVQAAGAAESVPARVEALAHYERALVLWPTVPDAPGAAGIDHSTLLCRAARAAALAGAVPLAGAFQRAIELEALAAAEAEAEGDRTKAGEHYAALSGYCISVAQGAEAAAAATRALALVPEGLPSRERSLALRALVLWRALRGQHLAEALGQCREAMTDAAVASAVDVQTLTGSLQGWLLWQLGDDDAGFAAQDRAAADAAASADPELVATAFANRLLTLADGAPTPSDAQRVIAETRAAFEAMDIRGRECCIEEAEVHTMYLTGAWDEVERRTRTWLGTEHDPFDDDTHFRRRGEIRIRRGFVDEGEADLRAAFGVLGKCPREFVTRELVAVHAALADASLTRARPDAALNSVDDGLDVLAGTDYVVSMTRLSALGLRCAADLAAMARGPRALDTMRRAREAGAAHRGRLDAALAGTLVEGMAAGTRVRVAAAWGLAEGSRLDGRSDVALWADALSRIEAWWGCGDLLPYARFRFAEALLLSAGDRETATLALRAAYARAGELNMEPLRGDIEALARRARLPLAGEKPERDSARYGLSSREREVLALLLDGRTNREIGERLFISEKTASVHVTHILDKLGVNSRGAAAALASREGLIVGPGARP